MSYKKDFELHIYNYFFVQALFSENLSYVKTSQELFLVIFIVYDFVLYSTMEYVW